MSTFLLAVSLLISSVAFSQDSTGVVLRQSDSLNEEIRKSQDYADSLRRKEDMDRMANNSINYFAELQRQRNARQKRQAILYITMGVLFLIVLIVGLRRKTKR